MTPDQERAVGTVGRDLCVVAGAGSGKTTVLATRFARLALAGRSAADRREALDRILALTFTDRAAAEMRERAARLFLEGGRPELRRAVESAWVSTFHGFCARILKENAVEAGIDPSFGVLAEGDAALLLEEAREEAVAAAAAARPAEFALLGRIAGGKMEAAIDDLLRGGRPAGGSFAALLAEASVPPPGERERAAVLEVLDGLARDRDGFGGAAQKAVDHALDAGTAFRLADPADSGAFAAAAAAVRAFRMPGTEGAKFLPAKPGLLALRAALDGVARALAGREAAPAAAALAGILDDAAARYAAAKAARGALDFADLEEGALDLLARDPDLAAEARDRFDAILVDEFQDTNPGQERLLALLRRPGRTFVVGDPKQAIYGFRGADVEGFARARAAAGPEGTVVLRENFRSRPEILRFANAVLAPAFAAGGGDQVPYEPLVPGAPHGPKAEPSVEVRVVAGPEAVGELRPREAALLAARLRELVDGGARITRCDNEGRPADRPLRWGDAAILLRAATDLAVWERALADAGIPYQVLKGRGFFEAREVVDLASLLQALEDPADDLALATVLRSPFAALDDGALLALVDALPRDGERAPLAFLLEPDRRVPGLDPAARARLDRFRGAWSRLREHRRRGRLHALVVEALEGTGYALAVLLGPGGRQRAANLRKIAERARAFEAAGAGGPAEFARLVRRLRLREERETEAPLAGEDAVSLLTIHQAKGLEWPVVALPDLARRPRSAGAGIVVRGGRAALRLRSPRPGKPPRETPLSAEILDALGRAEDAETVRLLHVALTRAREHLLLSASIPGKARAGGDDDDDGGESTARRTAWSALESLLPEAGEGGAASDAIAVLAPGTADAVEVRVIRGDGGGAGPAARRIPLAIRRAKRLRAGRGPGLRVPAALRRAAAAAVEDVAACRPVPVDGTPFLATVSAVLDHAACPLRYRLGHVLGVPDRAPPAAAEPPPPAADADPEPGPRREARPGAEDEEPSAGGAHGVPRWISGVAVHAILGTFEPGGTGPAAVRTAARERLAEELGADPPAAAVEEVARWAERFLDAPVGREVVAALGRGEALREQAFLHRSEGVLLRGQVDLVYRDGAGRWTVSDYKASAPPRRRASRARYERQLRMYARALRGLLPGGAAVERAALLYLDPVPAAVEVPLDGGGAEEIGGLLAAFARDAAADAHPARRDHCRACPFGPGGTAACAVGRAG